MSAGDTREVQARQCGERKREREREREVWAGFSGALAKGDLRSTRGTVRLEESWIVDLQ
jgi:hypothetical protein